MKKILVVALTLSAFASCTVMSGAGEKVVLTPSQALAKEAGQAVYWYQKSGEAKALYHQGFNSAKAYLSTVLDGTGKKAVVVDLDETMIDNSPEAAYQVVYGQGWSPSLWMKWVNAEANAATPGAVDYARYVVNHGGQIFYISNRSQKSTRDEKPQTMRVLKALGFPNVSSNTVMLKGYGVLNEKEATSNKNPRFDLVKNAGYEIVQYVGDNLNDFPNNLGGRKGEETNYYRRAWVEQNANLFGTKYIILPNPNYGNFEAAGHGMSKIKAMDNEYDLKGTKDKKWW